MSYYIWLFIFGHFSKFLLICEFYFWQISPHPRIYVSKDALNHVLFHSSAKNTLRSAENVVFFFFCILVDRPMGGKSPPLPSLRYSHRMSKNYLHRTLIFLLPKVYSVEVFIQHTVTNNVIKLHSRRHFIWCSIKSTHFLCETALLYCVGLIENAL